MLSVVKLCQSASQYTEFYINGARRLGNNRGTFWSSRHEFLRNDTEAFWDFTWDEMPMYDLPAEVNYIINATGHSSIGLVGHSQVCSALIAVETGSALYSSESASIIVLLYRPPNATVDETPLPSGVVQIRMYLSRLRM